MTRVKVALVSDCYLPRLGGIEVQVHDLARRLALSGHDVEVLTLTPSEQRFGHQVENADGVRVHRFPLSLPAGLLVNPFAVPAVRRVLRRGGFDVVHVHMGVVSPLAMDGVRLALGLDLPTVVTWHCMIADAEPVIRRLGYVARWARRGAVLTAVSRVAAEPVSRLAGVPVSVLPNGIDLERWRAGDERADDGAVRVVTAMRLARRKRPLELLEVVAEARRLSGQDVRLEVAGAGEYADRVARWVADHGADWVRLPGRLTREQLWHLYRSADLYVAPARLEAFGIAALEARTSGLPVVGPRSSGITEFVRHEHDGLLVGDDAGMAAAIARLATDRSLLERMREVCLHEMPRQSWSFVAEETVATYRRAMA